MTPLPRPTVISAAPDTFCAETHGPALWARLGWTWDRRAQAQARLFDGWSWERLAGVFGRSVLGLENVPGPDGMVLMPPNLGDLGVTGRALRLTPRPSGGFTATLGQHSPASPKDPLVCPPGLGAEVLAVHAGGGEGTGRGWALLRLCAPGIPDRLARVALTDLAGLWRTGARA